ALCVLCGEALLRESPIDDQRLAVGTEQDIGWLQVPVQHALAMRIRDRLADRGEAAEQLAKRQAVPRRLHPPARLAERVASHQAHRVARLADRIPRPAVDR